jgi:cystathionine beta-synthase
LPNKTQTKKFNVIYKAYSMKANILNLGLFSALFLDNGKCKASSDLGGIFRNYKYEGGSWLVEGIGEDFIPTNLNLDLVDDAVTVSDKEAFEVLQKLLKEEGILAGSSTGTLISGAIKWCQKQDSHKKVVTFVCDTGNKYLSKAFSKSWLKDNQLIEEKIQGNLSDLISRRADRGEMISIKPGDTLMTAYNRMRASDVSQLPVLEEEKLVGIVDEEDLLLNVYKDENLFSKSIDSIMVCDLETIDVNSDENALYKILSEGKVAIIFEGEIFLGFITKVDLINRYKSLLKVS